MKSVMQRSQRVFFKSPFKTPFPFNKKAHQRAKKRFKLTKEEGTKRQTRICSILGGASSFFASHRPTEKDEENKNG